MRAQRKLNPRYRKPSASKKLFTHLFWHKINDSTNFGELTLKEHTIEMAHCGKMNIYFVHTFTRHGNNLSSIQTSAAVYCTVNPWTPRVIKATAKLRPPVSEGREAWAMGRSCDLLTLLTSRKGWIYVNSSWTQQMAQIFWETCPAWPRPDRCRSEAIWVKFRQSHTDHRHREAELTVCSPLVVVVVVVFSLGHLCYLGFFCSRPPAAHKHTHRHTQVCISYSPTTHDAQGQPTGADLRSVCTGLALLVLEEIKCSSYSTGRIHVT